jgi:hypothetical protein
VGVSGGHVLQRSLLSSRCRGKYIVARLSARWTRRPARAEPRARRRSRCRC